MAKTIYNDLNKVVKGIIETLYESYAKIGNDINKHYVKESIIKTVNVDDNVRV